MNIKSLLLGSAAALVAVTGARAADVIVPMAEPVEYVRVCDVYGTGFHYIPGTETCMSISGFLRFQYTVNGPIEDSFGNDFLVNNEGDDYTAGFGTEIHLNFDVREETELGTLRAYMTLENNSMSSYGFDGNFDADNAYIQLGGLTMGYLDSLWTEGDGFATDTDLPVGDFEVNRVSYTFAAGGLAASISLEDDVSGDFAPNVVGKLGYSGGFGGFNLYGVYEESVPFGAGGLAGPVLVSPFIPAIPAIGALPAVPAVPGVATFGPNVSEDAFVLKANLSLENLIADDSELKFEGSYAFDPSTYSTIGLFSTSIAPVNNLNTAFGNVPVEWQIGAGYSQSFGKLGVAVAGVYGEVFDTFSVQTVAPFDRIRTGESDFYKLVGNVGYEITNNFDMLAEVSYTNLDIDGRNGFVDNEIDQTAGFLRFQRNF
ncbi:outer membrane protein [Fulvimarina pelagi HTCC2506]|uniref:Porin n=2 Tax=Fulvimarina pelagi TaxID=217511 RepID=Q0FZY5_9HYPH|nr:porin [Fulvimarina pelagi]EAU40456.1 outer membrane protein [Fulvimarina pelagi HTCC2506]BAT31485.1 outer membrane protein [Fulvimarina pelagi]